MTNIHFLCWYSIVFMNARNIAPALSPDGPDKARRMQHMKLWRISKHMAQSWEYRRVWRRLKKGLAPQRIYESQKKVSPSKKTTSCTTQPLAWRGLGRTETTFHNENHTIISHKQTEYSQKTTHSKSKTVVIGNAFPKGDYRKEMKDQLLLNFTLSSAVNSNIAERPQQYPRPRLAPGSSRSLPNPTSKGCRVLKQVSSEKIHRFNAQKITTRYHAFPTSSATPNDDNNAMYFWAIPVIVISSNR
jgi:hemin uptake protein HemP